MKIYVMYRYYKNMEVDDKFQLLNDPEADIYSDEYLQLFGELEELLKIDDEAFELATVYEESADIDSMPIYDN